MLIATVARTGLGRVLLCSQPACASSSWPLSSVPKGSPACSSPTRPYPSIIIGELRGRPSVAAAQVIVQWPRANVWSEGAHKFRTDRLSPLSPACVPTCAPQATHEATTSSAHRRADELLTGGESAAAPPTAAVRMARPEPGQRASSSARRDGGDHRSGTVGACGACGSSAEAPRAGLWGCAGGWDAAAVMPGTSTARPERGDGREAAGEDLCEC
eukprot:1797143-Prymnesium_polylepis.2